MQVEAARALGRLCATALGPGVGDVLELVERTGQVGLVATLVRAIGEGLGEGPRAQPLPTLLPALARIAREAQGPVAIAAIEALSRAQRAGAFEAGEALTQAFDHPDAAVVKAALLKLASAPSQPALSALDRG